MHLSHVPATVIAAASANPVGVVVVSLDDGVASALHVLGRIKPWQGGSGGAACYVDDA
jgi:hypothetical protein